MKNSVLCILLSIFFIKCATDLEPDEFTISMISTGDKILIDQVIDSLVVFSIKRTNGEGIRGKKEEKRLLSLMIGAKNDSNFIGAISEIFLVDGDSVFATQKTINNPTKFDDINYTTHSTVFKIGCKIRAGEEAYFTISIDSLKMEFKTGAAGYNTASEWFQEIDINSINYDSADSIKQTKESGLIQIKN